MLRAGDFVTQPPTIRHRVLECSDGLEVLEVGSPAVLILSLSSPKCNIRRSMGITPFDESLGHSTQHAL